MSHQLQNAPKAQASPARPSRASTPSPAPVRGPANHDLQRALLARGIQPKLTVNEPGDRYEREADRVAEQVMRMPEPSAAGAGTRPPGIQRLCADCEEELQRKASEGPDEEAAGETGLDLEGGGEGGPEGEEGDGRVFAKPLAARTDRPASDFGARMAASRGGGRPLPEGVRTFMESRFGADFQGVRVHDDGAAAGMARDIRAAAFTHGRDVYFGAGRFAPASASGRLLLAHELTHVIQQTGRGEPAVQRSPLGISPAPMGSLQRRVEVHVNLEPTQKVKLFRQGGTDRVFSPVSAGADTEPLAGSGTYRLSKRASPTAKIGRWGLQYFAAFHGGIGFHSNIAYPTMRTLCAERSRRCDPSADQNERHRITLTVDGTPRSHGCVRMLPSHAESLFNAVSNGTRVRVYHSSRGWQLPTWARP